MTQEMQEGSMQIRKPDDWSAGLAKSTRPVRFPSDDVTPDQLVDSNPQIEQLMNQLKKVNL